jgi:hypothetical protein
VREEEEEEEGWKPEVLVIRTMAWSYTPACQRWKVRGEE